MTAPSPPDQRVALQAVTTAAVQDLTSEWASLNVEDAQAVKAALRDLLPALAGEYGPAASELALDVYEVLRDAAGVTTDYEPQVGAVTDKLQAWAGWSADPLFDRDTPVEELSQTALTRASESIQKAVADQYRSTIVATSDLDEASQGWARYARPDGCPFCRLLASRGAVYSDATVDFAAHGNCHCLAVPEFFGAGRAVKAEFVPSTRNITAQDRARVYRYMRANGLLDGEPRRTSSSRR